MVGLEAQLRTLEAQLRTLEPQRPNTTLGKRQQLGDDIRALRKQIQRDYEQRQQLLKGLLCKLHFLSATTYAGATTCH